MTKHFSRLNRNADRWMRLFASVPLANRKSFLGSFSTWLFLFSFFGNLHNACKVVSFARFGCFPRRVWLTQKKQKSTEKERQRLAFRNVLKLTVHCTSELITHNCIKKQLWRLDPGARTISVGDALARKDPPSMAVTLAQLISFFIVRCPLFHLPKNEPIKWCFQYLAMPFFFLLGLCCGYRCESMLKHIWELKPRNMLTNLWKVKIGAISERNIHWTWRFNVAQRSSLDELNVFIVWHWNLMAKLLGNDRTLNVHR
jgi:hypothetical protein